MPDFTATKDHRGRILAGLAAALERLSLAELYTDDIAREASVSKRTFYEHFANKEACFLALYKENSARILAVLRTAVVLPELPMLERINRGTEAYLAVMQSQAPLMKRLYIDILKLGDEGMQAKRHVVQQFADLLIGLYEEERQRLPGMPVLKPELVLGVIAGLNELILFKIEDGEAGQLMELVETSRLMILGSIQGMLLQSSGN
ncbi:MAG: TetR/AcrR family transcriptional regulator [Moraxellaceae bacterium]